MPEKLFRWSFNQDLNAELYSFEIFWAKAYVLYTVHIIYQTCDVSDTTITYKERPVVTLLLAVLV